MQLAQGKRLFYVSLALLFAGALITAGLWIGGSAGADDAATHGHAHVIVTVERAWARPALQGGNGAVYLTIVNHGDAPVTLIGASADVAQAVEVHETTLVEAGQEAGSGVHNATDGHGDHAAGGPGSGAGAGGHDAHAAHGASGHDAHAAHGASDHGGLVSVQPGAPPATLAAAGTFVMQHVDRLEIPAHSSVEFQPGGLHIMLVNLNRTLAWGESFPVTLHFAGAPSITALVTVGDEPVNSD